jgi:hypothetical protein
MYFILLYTFLLLKSYASLPFLLFSLSLQNPHRIPSLTVDAFPEIPIDLHIYGVTIFWTNTTSVEYVFILFYYITFRHLLLKSHCLYHFPSLVYRSVSLQNPHRIPSLTVDVTSLKFPLIPTFMGSLSSGRILA